MNWRKRILDKSAQSLGGLQALAIGIVVAAFLIAFGARVTDDIRTNLFVDNGTAGVCGSTADPNCVASAAAGNGTSALADMSSFLPLLAIVGVAAVIITFLVGAFGRFR